ncbi:peptide chain release factor N(5)-glutamine methyltransferase [Candidatus Saccharibacteria bacterium]|nr:peptide chain release factor N(5)-glutamine methyltransferase [Candidatus Saccharibacteria bacterium]
MNISAWLDQAARQLREIGVDSARLDAELILANTLRKNRTYLHAHPESNIDPRRVDIANARLRLRLERVPLAYILGYRDFYGRRFTVSPQVLVPRPESEAIIELLKELDVSGKLLDIGTGSGCLGITAKLKIPKLNVILSDISQPALRVARQNAEKFQADVALIKSNLLRAVPGKFDIIIANLPYVDRSWQRSPETNHEPALALFAKDEGLALIYQLIDQLPAHLSPGALVFLEADPRQHGAIIAYAGSRQLRHNLTRGFIVVLQA